VLKLMSISDEDVNDQSVKEKINELRTAKITDLK
jgi:hypothetical protein